MPYAGKAPKGCPSVCYSLYTTLDPIAKAGTCLAGVLNFIFSLGCHRYHHHHLTSIRCVSIIPMCKTKAHSAQWGESLNAQQINL